MSLNIIGRSSRRVCALQFPIKPSKGVVTWQPYSLRRTTHTRSLRFGKAAAASDYSGVKFGRHGPFIGVGGLVRVTRIGGFVSTSVLLVGLRRSHELLDAVDLWGCLFSVCHVFEALMPFTRVRWQTVVGLKGRVVAYPHLRHS